MMHEIGLFVPGDHGKWCFVRLQVILWAWAYMSRNWKSRIGEGFSWVAVLLEVESFPVAARQLVCTAISSHVLLGQTPKIKLRTCRTLRFWASVYCKGSLIWSQMFSFHIRVISCEAKASAWIRCSLERRDAVAHHVDCQELVQHIWLLNTIFACYYLFCMYLTLLLFPVTDHTWCPSRRCISHSFQSGLHGRPFSKAFWHLFNSEHAGKCLWLVGPEYMLHYAK